MSTSHARFAPSSLYRIFACPGSLQLIESLPPPERESAPSNAARRGTAAHALAERCLTSLDKPRPIKPHQLIGQTLPEAYEAEDVVIDDDIANGVQQYVNFVKHLGHAPKRRFIELNLSLSTWPPALRLAKDNPNFNPASVSGTMDYMGVEPVLALLDVFDYKNGSGKFVNADDNPQILTYGLCAAVEITKKLPIDFVRTGIVQPNYPTADGFVRSSVLSLIDLYAWGEDVLLPNLDRALAPSAKRAPGDHCTWCPAAAHCPENMDLLLQATQGDFDDLLPMVAKGTNWTPPVPAALTPEQRLLVAQNAPALINFIEAVVALAQEDAIKKGVAPAGTKFVKRTTHRQFVADLDERTFVRECRELGLIPSELYTSPSLRSPSQIETSLRSKGVALSKLNDFLKRFVRTPDGGVKLVPLDHRGKPVTLQTPENDFDDLFA